MLNSKEHNSSLSTREKKAINKKHSKLGHYLKNIRMLEPLVSEALPLPKKLHQKVRRLRTLDEVEAVFPGFKAFLDATEQEIPRPKSKLKRKTHYSGKKKKHKSRLK